MPHLQRDAVLSIYLAPDCAYGFRCWNVPAIQPSSPQVRKSVAKNFGEQIDQLWTINASDFDYITGSKFAPRVAEHVIDVLDWNSALHVDLPLSFSSTED